MDNGITQGLGSDEFLANKLLGYVNSIQTDGVIAMKTAMPIFLVWEQMQDREQLVWAATFATQSTSSVIAAEIADEAVKRLRELNIDNRRVREPWEDAARAGFHIDRSDFDPWYRIASLLQQGNAADYREPNEQECAVAYDKFQRGRADFY